MQIELRRHGRPWGGPRHRRPIDRRVRVTTEEGIHKTLVDYRTGDMWAPKLENREALAVECEHFIECVRFNKVPRSSASAGLQVVRLLDAAQKSIGNGGAKVPV